MIRCVLLAAVFFASAFGLSQDDLAKDADPKQTRNICYFDLPSTQCQNKCREHDAEPFCQGRSCECRARSGRIQTNYEQVGGNELPSDHHPDGSPLQTTAQPDGMDKVILMKDYCFFGEYPSLACNSKCSHLQLVSYCQDDAANRTCLCRENQPEDVQEQSTITPDYADYCWFGEFPSAACRNKCGEVEAVCEHRHCLCSNTSGVLNVTATESEEESEDQESAQSAQSNMHHVLFLLQNLGGLFGTGNNTDGETAEGQGQGQPTLSTPTTDQPDQASVWSYHFLAAGAIALLLVLLVALEIYTFLKKLRAKNLQSVFSQMPEQMPNRMPNQGKP